MRCFDASSVEGSLAAGSLWRGPRTASAQVCGRDPAGTHPEQSRPDACLAWPLAQWERHGEAVQGPRPGWVQARCGAGGSDRLAAGLQAPGGGMLERRP